jgi:hypothetical protein
MWLQPRSPKLNHSTLIDVMRMVNAAIYGFIIKEQSDLMTLDRPANASYEVMLDALMVAIEHIKYVNQFRE